MKKIILSILIVLACKLSIGQKLVQTYYDWNKIHPKEVYYVNSVGQKSGTYKQYDENGVVVAEYNFLNGEPNGLCIDYAAEEHNKRSVIGKTTYKNGVKDGYALEFDPDNHYWNKLREGYYKDGKENGKWTKWFSSQGIHPDIIKAKWQYVNGVYNGLYTFYDDTDSGKVVGGGNYVNEIMVGKWTLMFNNYNQITYNKSTARLILTVEFDNNGKPTGMGVIHDLKNNKGHIEAEIASVVPALTYNGKVTWFYENGNKKQEVMFINGKRDGELLYYFEDGKLQFKQHWANDNKTGQDSCYSEEGKPITCQ